MAFATFRRGCGSRLVCGSFAAWAAVLAATTATAQVDPKADPTSTLLNERHPAEHPATLVVQPQPAPVDRRLFEIIGDVGESPLAVIYSVAGPDMRAFAQHDLTLSDPFFEGRFPGTRGNRMAADYVEYYFRQAHLRPAFASETDAADGTKVLTPNSSFRQPFSQGSQINVEQAEVSFDLGPDGVLKLRPDEQFTVLGSSGSGTVTAPIVLVGYGITEGQEGYTSYPEGTDLKGKIAVLFRFEPIDPDGKSRWAKDGWSPAASLDTKIAAAAEHHAAGIILVNPPGADDPRAKKLIGTRESRSYGSGLTIPVVMASTDAVDRLVQAGDPTDGPRRTLLTFRKQADERGGPISLPNATVTLTTRLSYEPISTDNVGAVLPGKGQLADQYIVIGAHYDHVGYGPVGTQPQNIGKLHPGADDNASGTSGVLVLADKLTRAYADLPDGADARSILFLTFSAEESGLIGSHWFVNHPSIDLSQIYLMLNMDMIGRLREDPKGNVHGMEVHGTESGAGFYQWLKPYFDRSGIEIHHGPEVATNSDHASFYNKKIPVLFFFTGYTPEYHTPQDTGFTINQIGAARVIGLVHEIALGAAQRHEPLKFTPKRQTASADPHADPHATLPAPAKGTGRVRFGIAPGSYSDDQPGVAVGDVFDGTPAAAAGIKPGDRLVKWNGKPIADVEGWTEMLMAQKPEDVVDVTVLRDAKELTMKVTLKARDQGGK